ncbi:response regulator [Clostridium vincentii]|uniref:Stage 0 sporulation protein A homolog n=1 Tax=Clostridium vincentii TaxID=52704 RepID=A0A2T0BB65_9CLOT|nr:response regulator transcription factor [Clostridium vincentii]PRR81128.1 Transcriptional regulatory protein DegU [Clostridium vincentii]
MIKLAIADDHALIREGLIRILSYEKNLQIVIESDSGSDLILKMEKCLPNIVLLDMNMEKVDGIQALKMIKSTWPSVKVIMLTVEKQKRKIKEALDFGADGYVLKESAGNEITNAITSVYEDKKYIDKTLLETVFRENYLVKDEDELSSLSPRELSILIKISEGMKNKQIGESLFLSEKTVKNYVTSLFRKIKVKDRVHATLFAINNKAKEYFEEKNNKIS